MPKSDESINDIVQVENNESMLAWEAMQLEWLNNAPERRRPSIVLPKGDYLDRTIVDRWRFLERAKPKINKDVLKRIIRGDGSIFRNIFMNVNFSDEAPIVCVDPTLAAKSPMERAEGSTLPSDLLYIPASGFFDDIEVPIGVDEPNWWPGRDKPGGGGSGSEASSDESDIVYMPISYEEFIELLQLLFDLPFLKATSMDKLLVHTYKMAGLRKTGPMVRWDRNATALARIERFRAALNARPEDYPPEWQDPEFFPTVEEFPYDKSDMRYKQVHEKWNPDSKAVIFYELDTSGSMGGEPLALAKFFFLITLIWLKTRYKEVAVVFIAHNALAERVRSEADFFRIQESGGTMFVPAHDLVWYLGNTEYGGGDWNRYCLHATDGYCFDDTQEVSEAIERLIRSGFNYFGYFEVNPYNFSWGGRMTGGMQSVQSVAADVLPYVGWSRASTFEDVPAALAQMMDKDKSGQTSE